MAYPEMLVAPMRQELTNVGFKQLMTASEVVNELTDNTGTKLLVFNSVCGCAAGTAHWRPGCAWPSRACPGSNNPARWCLA